MRWIVLLALAYGLSLPVLASDAVDPERLREKHAGSREFSSGQPVEALFPVLLDAAGACWDGRVKMGVGTGATGGALGSLQSASRWVEGDLAADGRSAHIVVVAKGVFGAMQSGFLQIDIRESGEGSLVTAFHARKVKAQRQFLEEVEHWLAGDAEFCFPKPMMERTRDRSR